MANLLVLSLQFHVNLKLLKKKMGLILSHSGMGDQEPVAFWSGQYVL